MPRVGEYGARFCEDCELKGSATDKISQTIEVLIGAPIRREFLIKPKEILFAPPWIAMNDVEGNSSRFFGLESEVTTQDAYELIRNCSEDSGETIENRCRALGSLLINRDESRTGAGTEM